MTTATQTPTMSRRLLAAIRHNKVIQDAANGVLILPATTPEPPPTPANIIKLAVNRQTAAEMLSVSDTTFYRLIKRGLIHPVKATRNPIFSVKELQRFLDDTTRPIEL